MVQVATFGFQFIFILMTLIPIILGVMLIIAIFQIRNSSRETVARLEQIERLLSERK